MSGGLTEMVDYEYTNIADWPNLDGITSDVAASAMTDKSLEYCRWDEDDEILQVIFTNDLSAGDKSILDTIVANNT
jgi:hypothetical protein